MNNYEFCSKWAHGIALDYGCGAGEMVRVMRARGALRAYYAAAWRYMGFGVHHKGKSVMAWSRDFCQWIDEWTHYRRLADIKQACRKHFATVSFIEPQWLVARLPAAKNLPQFAQRLIVRKMAGVVMVLR